MGRLCARAARAAGEAARLRAVVARQQQLLALQQEELEVRARSAARVRRELARAPAPTGDGVVPPKAYAKATLFSP